MIVVEAGPKGCVEVFVDQAGAEELIETLKRFVARKVPEHEHYFSATYIGEEQAALAEVQLKGSQPDLELVHLLTIHYAQDLSIYK